MNKKIIYLVVGIVVVIVAFFVFNSLLNKRVVEPPTEEPPVVDVISINNLIVPDQAAETEIFVEKVLLKSDENGGFVIIRREGTSTTTGTTTEEFVGDIVGVSRYLDPGVVDNLIVSLNDNETVEVGEILVAALYADDGDGLWNEETDVPLVNGEGLPILVSFTIMSQGDIDIGPKL